MFFYKLFFKEFSKPLSKEHFLQNNNAIQLVVWEEKIFKGYLLTLPWLSELFMEHNYLKEFKRGPPKKHSCEVW